LQNDLTK